MKTSNRRFWAILALFAMVIVACGGDGATSDNKRRNRNDSRRNRNDSRDRDHRSSRNHRSSRRRMHRGYVVEQLQRREMGQAR